MPNWQASNWFAVLQRTCTISYNSVFEVESKIVFLSQATDLIYFSSTKWKVSLSYYNLRTTLSKMAGRLNLSVIFLPNLATYRICKKHKIWPLKAILLSNFVPKTMITGIVTGPLHLISCLSWLQSFWVLNLGY